jgi:ATP-dependent Clp protease ATP-binding subunit ClpA
MSDSAILRRHFSQRADAALAGAQRAAQHARAPQITVEHLLLAVLASGGIGARALTAGGVTASTLEHVRHAHATTSLQQVPRSTAASQPGNSAAWQLPGQRPRARLMSQIFSRVRHPAESAGFDRAIVRAFRNAQQRTEDTPDTGDLVLGALSVLGDTPGAYDLTRLGLNPHTLAGHIVHERRQHPEAPQQHHPHT